MDNKSNNEKWVDEVMDSLNGMQRIPGSPGMYDNVMNRIASTKTGVRSASPALITRIAAAAILLLVINLASIFHLSHKTKNTQQPGIYQAVNEEISYLSEDSY